MKFSKHNILKTLENPSSEYFSIVNDVLALGTILSIFAIILETVPSLFTYHPYFLIIEWVTALLFSIEYGLRLWSARNRRAYALSFYGIIDLLAILPTIVGLGNFTFLKSARIIRIIRFLRLIRISKLARVNVKDVEETIGMFGLNIALYASTLILTFLAFGIVLHLFFMGETTYWSIPAGMYWTFAVFLGGLPAPIPSGTAGTILFIFAKFTGMALFGLLVGVVGKIFNQLILGKSETPKK
jgi:voltage-gated potassium channel